MLRLALIPALPGTRAALSMTNLKRFGQAETPNFALFGNSGDFGNLSCFLLPVKIIYEPSWARTCDRCFRI
jgi:hypothetical protein